MKKSIKNFIYIFVLLIFLIILGRFFFLSYYNKEKGEKAEIPVINNNETIIEKINYEEIINNLKNDYDNDDIVGILSVENADFSEIIVQTTDNDYYLEHSLSKEYDWRGQGFLDYRVDINNSKKLLIYGHNAPNNDVPFKFFENYFDSSFLREHKYIYLQTDERVKKFEIFSVYVEVSDWSYFSKINFSSDEEFYNHILNLKNKSLYDTGVKIDKTDEILIIQTCSYHGDYISYEDKFLLIIGKRIN